MWTDAFASETKKSAWLSVIMVGATTGNIAGYLLAAVLQDLIGWRGVFYIQAVAILLVVAACVSTPGQYVNLRTTHPRILEHQHKAKEEAVPILTGFKMILRNPGFLRMCFAVTVLYYVVTGIQFWYSDFAITVMKVKREIVFTVFGVVSISGPVLGVVFGGFVAGKIGGYNHPHSLYLTAAVASFAVVCAAPAAFIPAGSLFPLQVFLLWSLLFAGGFVMPNITGVMLNTVEEHLKTSANAIGNMSFNVFGFLPSPYVYGAIADSGGVVGGNKRAAMIANLSVSIFSASAVVYHALQVRGKEAQKAESMVSEEPTVE